MPPRFDRGRRSLLAGGLRATGAALLATAAELHAKPVATDGPALSGIEQAELIPFDALLTRFVREQQVPGAQLAVSHQGRLVYARGVGWADREQATVVEPSSLFRIASVSKPITATAVLQFVERGRLALDAGVWALLGLAEPADPRWKRISVRHLLQHSGGWDREQSFDPMFQPAPFAQPQQIILRMLALPLQFEPGSRQAYSNFGYCLLGRLIERISGMSYQSHVQREVLLPLSIRRMRLGKTALAQRAPSEVLYYAERNHSGNAIVGTTLNGTPLPYGAWSLEAMDAHGGWLASAIDLARFACAFDEPAQGRILNADSIATMFARPAVASDAAYYACGWRVRASGRPGQLNTWHTGSFDGTSALLVRRHDGNSWAILFNTRTAPDGQRLSDKIDPMLHRAADQVRSWPQLDQFRQWP